ncbi:type VI secretion system tip protein VgrG [Pseudomonas fakonensis]|uniref:Type VI secretion system tip protein VgrG n=1 Tax=Pseudomonas fakonensis TaxID=2842355 RepID=A0ABX8MY42_9PSED|nr:type VI secretion system tip protein VgrG [Pseudomonas fakonensis]QXH49190.1 type VI secretion system tip protein VgrG [Pseudomonas fakonensis]
MFTPANQPSFTLAIQGANSDLRVLAFTGFEALNQPYAFDLQLISEYPALDLSELLHKPAFFSFTPEGQGIHGIIDRIAQGDSGKRFTRYEITLRPRLARLAHRVNQRIFQDLTVPEIITQVLKDHGILGDAHEFHLGYEYPPRNYCVQYNESDLHFIQRLCEEEGLSYHFQHSSGDHRLVFGDDQTVFPKLAAVTYQQDSGQVADDPVIKQLAVRVETRTTRATRRDYDFKNPRLLLESAHSTERAPDLEDYDYPGRFTDRERGKLLATRAVQRHRADYRLAEGCGDVARLVSGHFLPLAGHGRDEWNDLWLLTSIRHEGKQPQVLEEALPSATTAHKDDFHQGYRNSFTATPWDQPFRPALRHDKQRIRGSQRALVTGPAGEEIHCDSHGRVKVQFFWDREGAGDDQTSCWLRVSSAWAGARYGGIAIPRIGMEVLVGFLEGDPDQPLVTGCLYHRENAVPYPLPANKTRSVFKTLSSPGGKGFNELRIEDKKGQEQIFINAQRDWEQRILHDQKIRVGRQRHDTVEANSHTEFKAEEHTTVDLDRKAECRADDHLTIAVSQHLKIATGQFIEAGTEIHLSSGQKVVMEAGAALTLKAGGSWVQIDGGGVAMSGASIKLNQGGSPGVGTAVAALLPGPLRQAIAALAGAVPAPAALNPSGITRLCGKQSGGGCSREDCTCLNRS